ncbi:MAG: PilZ domain-containing protein [Candidatus Electrothrix sp. AR4]|nr:PilZ domain-containing protein [Candidatus Electrothrix sp. AR4]
MNSNKIILSKIPEDERSPLIDGLLKFINWQTLRIEKLEVEIQKLKLKSGNMNKETNKSIGGGTTNKVMQGKQPVPQKGGEQRTLELDNIQHHLLNMANKNKRQFSRINIQWDARLDFGAKKYKQTINNISLSGIYVKGCFNQQTGDICSIILNQADSDVAIHATGSIARINDDGMALEFTSMKLDIFFLLQTILLHEAVDPATVGEEFVNNINLEIENDLVLCDTFKL